MKPKWILLVLVLIIAVAWYFFSTKSEEAPEDNSQSQENIIDQNPDTQDDSDVEEVPNSFEGELLNSNDKRRGNLMLLMKDSDRIIYLNTSRDFSSLIGKSVSVSIEGSLDDFVLLDIQAVE